MLPIKNILLPPLRSFTLYHLDVGNTQPLVKANLPQQRPPVVKENLHGVPHGDPTDDGEAFARDAETGIDAIFSKWGIQLNAVMIKLCNGIRYTASAIKIAPSRGRLPSQLRRIYGVVSR